MQADLTMGFSPYPSNSISEVTDNSFGHWLIKASYKTNSTQSMKRVCWLSLRPWDLTISQLRSIKIKTQAHRLPKITKTKNTKITKGAKKTPPKKNKNKETTDP